MREFENETITDTIDKLQKVESVLDFLTSEVKNNGLGHILLNCQQELQECIGNLVAIEEVDGI